MKLLNTKLTYYGGSSCNCQYLLALEETERKRMRLGQAL